MPTVYASEKASETTAIAIVFDNSGSMYMNNNQAWCRATYAMEVFASMLNDGDTLLIYPMNAITLNGTEYTMDNPYKVTDAAQASTIREIYTPHAGVTPIESVDSAISGLKATTADNKCLIILTDGSTFYSNDKELSLSKTKDALDQRIQQTAGRDISVMYLGVGTNASMPSTAQSEYFVKKQAAKSEDVLSTLTYMCNQIFGRDTLPKNHIAGNTIDFDISVSKLIVFVQGENISGLNVTSSNGGSAGTLVSTQQTKYATTGCGTYSFGLDDSLQGMMVTYTNCNSGTYTINYSGTATSIEVYYEPDADLDFVFTDADGNTVDSKALYEGDYKVSFGMKDAKTGKLISSDLLGNPAYDGTYYINGQEYKITHDGYSGEVPITLNMGDSFKADLTVTYLSGYTISKDSSDFGWPEFGIEIVARPAGELRLDISGGDTSYPLQQLEEGTPYTLKVYYQGEQLTGDALGSTELTWNSDASNANIDCELTDDCYILRLKYKDQSAPQETVCGVCSVPIQVSYTAPGSNRANASASLTYEIVDDYSSLSLELYAADTYIVISELDESSEIIATVLLDGEKLSAEDFDAIDLSVDCDGISYELTEDVQNSCYRIKLVSSDKLSEGSHRISVSASYTDDVGRVAQASNSTDITLSSIPLWVKWAINLLLLLILLIIILIILHIKVLPKHAHVNKKDSNMMFDGEDESKSTNFSCKMERGTFTIYATYAGIKSGVTMEVKPGKESYLKKPQAKRTAEVKSSSVRKYGSSNIQELSIGSVTFLLNEDNNKLERMPKSDKPFMLKHGMQVRFSGTMMSAGVARPYTATMKLNFKK